MSEHVYVCFMCGRIEGAKIDKCPLCGSENVVQVELSALYGGG